MKSLISSIAILGLVGMVVVVGANAATEATVAATVTAQLITISVADGNVDYGILPINATEDTTLNGNATGTQTVTNNVFDLFNPIIETAKKIIHSNQGRSG